ncbi:hypothetical protein BJX66DRAFT_319654 [Aspergillus keveii]|uniref:Uncharacterized protein n=1 Tax=Aspergillus keveii TaxID=714993 RepID=A0ABR4FIE6_9EURO
MGHPASTWLPLIRKATSDCLLRVTGCISLLLVSSVIFTTSSLLKILIGRYLPRGPFDIEQFEDHSSLPYASFSWPHRVNNVTQSRKLSLDTSLFRLETDIESLMQSTATFDERSPPSGLRGLQSMYGGLACWIRCTHTVIRGP